MLDATGPRVLDLGVKFRLVDQGSESQRGGSGYQGQCVG